MHPVPVTDHVTPVLDDPPTIAMNDWLVPTSIENCPATPEGAMEIIIGSSIVTNAEPAVEPSACEVAVTVSD